MSSFNNSMAELGRVRSVIRDIFEYGNKRAEEIGRENVFDFSLGNPSVPSPKKVNETAKRLLESWDPVALHGYTSAPGAPDVRRAVADDINSRFGAGAKWELIYMTCGAAASLTVTLGALCEPGDEVIAFAPFFPEYKVFAEASGAKLVTVDADLERFGINFASLEKKISKKTKAVILNSPNNPSGAVVSPADIKRLCDVLRERSEEYSHPIYLVSDEPYRELVYDEKTEVPYLMNEYGNTVVCYSFSKSLSLPGERIGYIAVSPRAEDADGVFAAICGAGRALGYVCAPSLFQRVAKECLGLTSDIDAYRENRDLIYSALTECGFECVHPDGAFYLFMKSPIPDAKEFCDAAKKYELLLVPSDSFGVEGYVRISYCVSNEMIKRSLPAFKKLAQEFGL